MGRIAKEEPKKKCLFCKRQLVRKRFNGRLEDMNIFKGRNFCDMICSGKKHRKIFPSRGAFQKRAKLLRKLNCEICNTTKNLHTHHKNENWWDNRSENLQTLCGSCHLKYHWKNGKKVWKRQSVCIVCGNTARKLDMCQKHYQRLRKYGNPLMTKKRTGSKFILVREEKQ